VYVQGYFDALNVVAKQQAAKDSKLQAPAAQQAAQAQAQEKPAQPAGWGAGWGAVSEAEKAKEAAAAPAEKAKEAAAAPAEKAVTVADDSGSDMDGSDEDKL